MHADRSGGIMISFASVDISVVFKESLLRNPTGARVFSVGEICAVGGFKKKASGCSESVSGADPTGLMCCISY